MDWMTWYNGLEKPDWTPSPSTIGLIWQIIYPIIVITFGFVFAPLFVWLVHHFGNTALWAAPPSLVAAFAIFRSRLVDEDISDAEYYRRKALKRCAD